MTDAKGNPEVDTTIPAKNISRRKAVKTIVGGVSALAAYHTLPVNWSKPIIEQVFLPAHAQTSGSMPDVPVDPGISYSVSCSGTPACGSTVAVDEIVNVTATVTPNPGAGQLITIGEFCGGVSTGSTSLVTNANGEVTITGAVPSTLCFGDPSFALSFSYSGATCTCEWFNVLPPP